MQGAHQLAQKFSTSSLPPKSEREMVLPWSVEIVNLGARSPLSTTVGSSVPATTTQRATVPAASASLRTRSVLFPKSAKADGGAGRTPDSADLAAASEAVLRVFA